MGFERLRQNAWLLRSCRDWQTLRALKRGWTLPLAEPQQLRLRQLAAPILYRPGTSDLAVAWELFQRREYECERGWRFPTVVDCGANVGLFLAFAVMQQGRGLRRYVGVEPDSGAFALLERQAAVLSLRDASLLLQAAAWEHDGDVDFDARGPSWGHRVREGGSTRVPAMRIDSILDAAGLDECDLLKLDIEGGEREVLAQIPSWGPRVRTLVVELHDGLDYPWFAAHVDAAGFEPFPPGELFRAHPGAIRRRRGASSAAGPVATAVATVCESAARDPIAIAPPALRRPGGRVARGRSA